MINKKKLTKKGWVVRISLYLILVTLAVILLFPYVFMVMRGLMTNTRFKSPDMHIFPDTFMFLNYVKAFSSGGYFRPLLNSLMVCAIVGIATPLSSLLAAFAFARIKWFGRNVVFALVLSTLMLPGIVTQVPLFVMYNSFGMLDTLYPLYVPSILFGGAMNIFLARQFLISHPTELYESARIDGASTFKQFISIAIPLSKAIFIYIGISAVIGAWGDYYTPSIYTLTSEGPKTFAYALFKNLNSNYDNIDHPEWIFAACTVLSIVPGVLYAVFQKYLVQGIATAGLKG